MSTSLLPTDQRDVFGPMVSRGDVASAVISTLQSSYHGIIFYLAARERIGGLLPRTLRVPPSIDSYRKGLDFDTRKSDDYPLLIVVVQREPGTPERHEGGQYAQWFAIQVAALVEEQSEADSLELADHYGIATTACLGQNPSLGGLAVETRMTSYPVTEFPDLNRRTFVRAVTSLHAMVEPVFSERFGPWPPAPAGPPPDPYADPGDYPLVEQVDLTLTADPLPDAPGTSSSTTVVLDQG